MKDHMKRLRADGNDLYSLLIMSEREVIRLYGKAALRKFNEELQRRGFFKIGHNPKERDVGDYTGLRFKAKLTPHAHMALVMAKEVRRSAFANENVRYEDVPPFWDIVRSQGIKIPAEFLAAPRNSFIPFGVVSSYLPEDWGSHKFEILPEGVIEVACSLKDFGYRKDGEELTEMFCEKVLPLLIRKPCTAEILYEYWAESRIREVIPEDEYDRSEEG